MSIFTMYMSISGSGKTTLAYKENDFVIDSDEMREKLFGDAKYQGDNDKVFETMYAETVKALRENHDVAYVATNLSSKRRIALLQRLRAAIPNTLKCVCVVVCAPIHVCKERNNTRERHVPEYVIDRQLQQFQIPYYGEGWDDIVIEYTTCDTHDEVEWKEQMWDEIKKFGDQGNPHHSLTLYGHLLKCMEEVKVNGSLELLIAASLHDVGKLYTRTIDEKGISHYYGHENVSAYITLCFTRNLKIIQLVNYHMLPYHSQTKKWQDRLGKDFWELLLILNAADIAAK